MQHQHSNAERLAIGLGCFSIGLGLAEVFMPHAIARFAGVAPTERTRGVLRACGVREIGHGLAILSSQPDRASAVWSRVGGDAIDIAAVADALGRSDTQRGRALAATAALLGVTALDVLCAIELSSEGSARSSARRAPRPVRQAITVNVPLERVFTFWRDEDNLRRCFPHLAARRLEEGPAREHELSWRTTDDPAEVLGCSVSLERAPGARGTEVRVQLDGPGAGGLLPRKVAHLVGLAPEDRLKEDLRRFRQLIEAGELAVSDGPGLKRPARPAERPDAALTMAGVQR